MVVESLGLPQPIELSGFSVDTAALVDTPFERGGASFSGLYAKAPLIAWKHFAMPVLMKKLSATHLAVGQLSPHRKEDLVGTLLCSDLGLNQVVSVGQVGDRNVELVEAWPNQVPFTEQAGRPAADGDSW